MYRIWYWATTDREYVARFIASIPDLWDLAANSAMDKEAVARVADLGVCREYCVRAIRG
jgi:hypothetical protein